MKAIVYSSKSYNLYARLYQIKVPKRLLYKIKAVTLSKLFQFCPKMKVASVKVHFLAPFQIMHRK